ncbi:MAG: hypothetical protein RLZZ493_46, partial [Bacteroidota bacterium]
KLIFSKDGLVSEIDARTSDAIALAVRFHCPIYTFESILSSAGILSDEMMLEDEHEENLDSPQAFSEFQQLSKEELENALQEAIENENYERASLLRDEINKRTN